MRFAPILAAILVLTGCSAAPLAELPDGVTIAVLQNRSDYASRTLEISVTNGSPDPLQLETAAFDSPRFTEPAEWSRGTTLAASATVNLRVILPSSVCDPDDDSNPTVTVSFVTVDGARGRDTVVPTDPLDRLATIARDDCLGQAVAAVAPLEMAESLAWTPGARAPAQLGLFATPNAAGGSLLIESVDRTVLLSVVADGKPVESLPIDLRVAAPDVQGGAGVDFIPARCDPHAVAEDKRGTFFPVHVTVTDKHGAEQSGLVYVPVTDEVRVAIYDYIADYCGY